MKGNGAIYGSIKQSSRHNIRALAYQFLMNLVVFSGGTATNNLTPCFSELSIAKGCELSFILPISDNGGSTSEILRVLGGPAIGDIRSRVVRLVTDDQVEELLSYRLPNDKSRAKQEWDEILEGNHPIWDKTPMEVKEICRAFFIHVQSELLKRKRTSNPFRFEKASIGNFFLTGARLFLGSLDASVELMMRIGRCDPNVHVIPCINSNHTHHISALLSNGDIIAGQSQISHPSKPIAAAKARSGSIPILSGKSGAIHLDIPEERSSYSFEASEDVYGKQEGEEEEEEEEREEEEDAEEEEEYANPIYILPELKNSQLHFDKLDVEEVLPAPIERLFYINPYGEEVKPSGNSRAIAKLKKSNMVIYSIGSLFTSLLPIAILGNIAEAISSSKNIHKVLLINNKYDRETSWLNGLGYVQVFIESMTRANRKYKEAREGIPGSSAHEKMCWKKFVTDIVYLTGSEVKINKIDFLKKGIKCHEINSDKINNENLMEILKKIHITGSS